MSASPQKKRWEYIDFKRACELDLQHRVAWATEVVARILALYSPYFREKYHQERAIDFARRFYLGQSVNDKERRSIIHAIEDLVGQAESEGYNRNLLAPGAHLLIEIECDDGKGSTNAVDYSSLAFASHLLFRQGVRGTGMPVDYIDALADKGYAFAWDMFKLVTQHQQSPTFSIPFGDVRLSLTCPALPKELVLQSKRKPPAAESAYLAGQALLEAGDRKGDGVN